jgi:hydroxymethylbilane synthase
MQLAAIRPDLIIKDLRGNVDTRIRKLKEGEFDAIILAAAGINRLGFADLVNYFHPISLDEMIPSMGQGALGIETIDESWVLEIAALLEDKNSRIETTLEREFVDTLQGGCQVPIGVSARVQEDGSVVLRSILGLPDATEVMSDEKILKYDDIDGAGRTMAQGLMAKGAMDLLGRACSMADGHKL